MGPPLSGIGARRSATHLRAKILDPANDVPDTFRAVSITTRDGRSIRGIRLNEDTFSLQLRDFGDRFHSIWKDDISQITSEKRTTMPSARGRLTDQEIDDLVAYLAGQRGAQ